MSHLPPLVLYLYPDGLEFGGWWRRLLFCHWLKAVNLIEQKKKNTDKNRHKNLRLESTLVDQECAHTEHVDTTREGWQRTGMRPLLSSAPTSASGLCPARLLPPCVPRALGSAWLELCPCACGIPHSLGPWHSREHSEVIETDSKASLPGIDTLHGSG